MSSKIKINTVYNRNNTINKGKGLKKYNVSVTNIKVLETSVKTKLLLNFQCSLKFFFLPITGYENAIKILFQAKPFRGVIEAGMERILSVCLTYCCY